MIFKHLAIYSAIIIVTALVTAVIEKNLIPRLRLAAKQPIYAEGPTWHLTKSGTPTMGGLAFLISSSLSLIIAALVIYFTSSEQMGISLMISAGFAILNSCVGIFDDTTKLRRKNNAGLTPRQKLLLQSAIAMLFILLRASLLGDTTIISFSFGKIDFGFLYYPLSLLMLLGIVNCANLTDGVDGLASSVAFSIGVVFLFLSASALSDSGILAAVMIGASIGFLIFNIYPAKIFMGDTGSLFFGALAISCAFSVNNPFVIIFIGGIYVIEGISVILQVLYYKACGKRLFKMAPIHHHLERCGISEVTICIIAIICTLLLSIGGLMILAR